MPHIAFPLFWWFRVDRRKRFEYAKEFYVNTVRQKKKKTLLCQAWKSTGILKYIFIGHCPDYAHARKTFLSLKRLVTILSLARPPGDLESLFHSPYCFFEGKLFSEVNLWHLTYPPLWLLAHKAFAESFHFSRLAAMVLASLRPMIPILHSFFLFQPFASSWSLVFLFFCFLLVPKSLLCCSRCFGPVFVYVRSCLICSFTLFHLFTQRFHIHSF